jgi:large subunit ribosomal protein L22
MIMKVTAKLNNLRIAPRKSKLVADLIKGRDVSEALIQLEVNVKRTNAYMAKLLLSAIANAENNFGLDKNNLYVFDVRIGAGPTLKRWMPKAFGRAGQILKRTSKIEMVLEEKIEGKNRKTKEQMEKEKSERIKEKKKREKEIEKEEKETAETEKGKEGKVEEVKKNEEKSKKDGSKKGWARKMFNRKSM